MLYISKFVKLHTVKHISVQCTRTKAIPVAARFMAWVYGHSLDGIAGSKPAGGMGACLLRVLCIVR